MTIPDQKEYFNFKLFYGNGILELVAKLFPFLRTFILLLLLSLTVFVLDAYRLLTPIKTGISYLTNPISFGLYQTNQQIFRQFYFISAMRLSSQENKALKEQIGNLLSENAKLRRQLSETQSLVSQQLHLNPETYNLKAARPIGLSRYLKIDQGANSGIATGQAVVVNDNYIGRIIATADKWSKVQLLEDPDSKVAAFSINKEGQAKGVLTGQFGTEMIMDKILHEEKISQGDLVYSEGSEGNLPRGLILGRVSEVIEKPNQLFKQAKVKPVFDLRDLDLVFVTTE